MKNKLGRLGLTPSYSAVQFFYWLNFVTVSGYASVYLLYEGIANTLIGLLIGISCLIAALLQPVIANYADRASAVSIKVIVLNSAALAALMALMLVLFGDRSRLVCGILFGICTIILEFMLPFINSLGSEMILQGKKLNWGVSRAAGSVAYAVMSAIMGVITARLGPGSIPAAIMIGFLILILSVFIYPFVKKNADNNNPQPGAAVQSDRNNLFSFFKKYPKFSVLLVGMVFAYTSHMLLNTFLFQIVEGKGSGSIEMGRIMSICAFAELPALLCFNFLLKKAGSDVWLRLSGIFLAVKAVGTLLAPDINALYGVSLLQMGGWALIAVAPVYYVNQIVGADDRIKGQAYMAMTYTVGNVLSSFIGGKVLDYGGVSLLLICAAVAGVSGAILMQLFSERFKRDISD